MSTDLNGRRSRLCRNPLGLSIGNYEGVGNACLQSTGGFRGGRIDSPSGVRLLARHLEERVNLRWDVARTCRLARHAAHADDRQASDRMHVAVAPQLGTVA